MQVMRVVKNLAGMGITLVSSIHSPTPFCFNLFDRVLLLLRGSVIYFGPNGASASFLVDWSTATVHTCLARLAGIALP